MSANYENIFLVQL